MKEEQALQIHNILYKYCSDFLNIQEITNAANEIVKNPTESKVLEMTTYLDSFDTMRNGQSDLLPTSMTKGLTANNVRFAMSEIRALLNTQEQELDDALFTAVLKAPLHDASETIADNELVTGYTITVGKVTKSDNMKKIPITFAGTNLKAHTNGAGASGYWMGIAIPDSVLPGGYSVKFKRGFGSTYDLSDEGFDNLPAEYFEADTNIASTGKYCSFYREVGQAKAADGHAFVILKLEKASADPIYYVYDYDYTNVTLVTE